VEKKIERLLANSKDVISDVLVVTEVVTMDIRGGRKTYN